VDGFALSAGTCVSCDDVGVATAIGGVVLTLVVLALTAWWFAVRKAEHLKSLADGNAMSFAKTALGYAQILAPLSSTFLVELGPYFGSLTKFLAAFNLDFVSFLPLGCVSSMNHHSRLLMYTLVVGVLDIGCLAVQRFVVSKQAGQSLLTAAFFVNSLLLPQVSMAIFDTFPCRKFDGDYGTFLASDMTIDCLSATHGTMRVYATVMIFVFPIGMPLLSFWLLMRNKHKLDPGQDAIERSHAMRRDGTRHDALKETISLRNDHGDILHLSFLYESYEPKFWWYEILEVYRRIVLTGGLRIMEGGGGAQYGVALLICTISLRTVAVKKPFVTLAANRVNEIASWGLLLTLIGAMVTASNENVDGSAASNVLLDVLLAGVQVGGVLLAVAVAFYERRHLMEEMSLAKVLPAEEVERETWSGESAEVARLRRELEEERVRREVERKAKEEEIERANKLLADFEEYKKKN
jgi:hypothetical protein